MSEERPPVVDALLEKTLFPKQKRFDKSTECTCESLLDAQLLLGMIERYRPGTAQEARRWFAEHLQKTMNS